MARNRTLPSILTPAIYTHARGGEQVRDFEGKVAVVTGAASGMGRAFSERFAAEGMKVVLADIEAGALDATVAALRQREHDVLGVVADVSQRESVVELARQAVSAYGKVHVLCNNAGVDGFLGTIWESTPRDWQWTFGVNFWGIVHGVEAFLPGMLAHGEAGHIVNTASATAVVPANTIYGVTKHAALAYSEAVYTHLKQQNAPIGVTCLCPGIVNTRIFYAGRNRPDALRDEAPEHERDASRRNALRTRIAQGAPPEEVASILVEAIRAEQFYLLTDDEWDERARQRGEAILGRGVPAV
jgi:NAD(P)-dependent dehydrogenase (short-subunit alcohol dehydrogenase family)